MSRHTAVAPRRHWPAMLNSLLLLPLAAVSPSATLAQPSPTALAGAEPAPLTVDAALANARRFARITTLRDCLADRAATGDIVVCGAPQDEGLPVPEVYGPVRGSTDGAAVDPHLPCEFTPERCFEGVNLPRLFGAVVSAVGLLFDPDRNLGEGERIPERFRGANR